MKGIILAGGRATRLLPATTVVSKQLLPIYDKPMIYYPLTTLILAGIRDILIITTRRDQEAFRELLGDGSQFGLNLQYTVQDVPNGLAQAFVLGKTFIGSDKVALVLGDNLFYGHSFGNQLAQCTDPDGGIIFAMRVAEPERYGVVEFGDDGRVISLEEKPSIPKSNFAIPGLYFYDNDVVGIAESLKPSNRGEYEITDVNLSYLRRGQLFVREVSPGTVWFDTGTFKSLIGASAAMQALIENINFPIGSPEAASYHVGFIDEEQLARLAEPLMTSGYGRWLDPALIPRRR